MDYNNCLQCKCQFPHSHAAKKSLRESGSRGIPVKRAVGFQASTKHMRNEVNSFEEKDTIAKADAKLAQLIGELAEKLKSDVYSVQRKS